MMEDLETCASIEFHGVAYVVTISVEKQSTNEEPQLYIQVEVDEQQQQPQQQVVEQSKDMAFTCWTGLFPANYIEDITRKTGNFKRFQVFVNMLLSALTRRSDAVFIDLLTNTDLELYRKRKLGKRSTGTTNTNTPGTTSTRSGQDLDQDFLSSSSIGNNSSNMSKRYLILTYVVEFDRVHYPLPLTLVDTPTPAILQKTIRRLRQENKMLSHQQQQKSTTATGGHFEIEELMEENRCLKNTLKQYYDTTTDDNKESDLTVFDLKKELELTLQENKELIEIYQQLRQETTQEKQQLLKQIEQLKRVGGDQAQGGRQELLKELERKNLLNKSLEQEKCDLRKKLLQAHNSLEEVLSQLKQTKIVQEELTVKNREVMRQLAIERAKNATNNTSQTVNTPGSVNNRSSRLLRSSSTANRMKLSSVNRRSMMNMSIENEQERIPRKNTTTGGRSATTTTTTTTTTTPTRPFRRFDPTAYQREKEQRKQQQQQQSRRLSSLSPSQSSRRLTRRDSITGGGGGYASDSSMQSGYSSADSNASRRSTRSSREKQRQADDRLSSPKYRIQGQLDSTRSITPSRRTSSTTTNRRSLHQAVVPPPPAPAPVQRSSRSRQSTVDGSKNIQKPVVQGDSSMDSLSDIDERLSALQQFLKEAKKNTSSTHVTTTKVPS